MTTVDLAAWVVVALLYAVGLVAGLIQKRRQDRAAWSQALEHYHACQYTNGREWP